MTTQRYGAGIRNYDEDPPIWARNDSYDLQPKHPSYTNSMPRAHTPIGGLPSNSAQPHNTTIVHSSVKPMPDSDIYRVGIYGWRKRCLYCFILMLTIIIVINLTLTIWIMSVLDFSSDGMGALKITEDGIRVEGRAEFDRPVKFSELSAPEGEALFVDSSSGVYISAKNVSGHSSSSLNLSPEGKTTAVCQRFEVLDMDHKLLFFVDEQEIGLKLENLRVLDDGGSVFEGAIQTAFIQPEPDTPLRLESPTRNLFIDAGQDIELMSGAGEIQLNALLDINFNSKNGEIRLDAGSIYMGNLERSSGVGNSQFQLCICQNGRLFVVNERADCRADRSICS
ncbi:hypothetical protein M3Y94_01170600 [Aphelenchoides besseyi]|nr:hypothetical protein M3Y94_01170600 [Aphelenchoides besseyi]KAI6228149.1 hypothetical protein M3Y95_00591800 [Aphelenchoides besseyi]